MSVIEISLGILDYDTSYIDGILEIIRTSTEEALQEDLSGLIV